MKKSIYYWPSIILATLVIAACTTATTDTDTDELVGNNTGSLHTDTEVEKKPVAEEKKEAQEEPVVETKNVNYRGTVHSAGISIYMEGTHRLSIAENRFILLESDTISLDDYLEQEVDITGSVRPTVEAGGMIMRVEKIVALESTEESTASGTTTETEEGTEESDDTHSITVADTTDEEKETEEATEEKEEDDKEITEKEEKKPVELSADMQAIVDAIAAEDLSPDRWVREYCSPHMNFCVPIHKNWWFRSFGATNSYVWHVELNNGPIDMLGDGPISINVLSGTLKANNATDGEVRVENGVVTGYRSLIDNARYFEITAPAALKDAVTYLTKNLQLN